MNQYQNRNSEEQKTFLSKVKDTYSSKFGNLSITTSIQKASSYVDKDGNSESDTLIHNAFVKYYDTRGEPYPEWLGVPQKTQAAQKSSPYQSYNGSSSSGSGSRYQQQYRPVYTNYNSNNTNNNTNNNSNGADSADVTSSDRPQVSPVQSQQQEMPTYKPRSSSRLQDMYNKSRQQHTPGAGYNTVTQNPNRSNGSTSGSRLRERMMSSNSMTGMSNHLNDGRQSKR